MASTLTFKLVTADGTPADPPTFKTVAPLWRPGDTIPLGARSLRVVDVRVEEGADPVLMVDPRERESHRVTTDRDTRA